MAEVVPAPCPTASTLVRIPEGISAGGQFKFEWDGSSINVKCPEGRGAGDEVKVDAPTAAHRRRIKEIASKALHDLPKLITDKRQKLEHNLGPSPSLPPPAPPPPAAPHLAAPTPPDQGADALSALSSAEPQRDRDDLASAAPPLLQLLADTRAAVQRDLVRVRVRVRVSLTLTSRTLTLTLTRASLTPILTLTRPPASARTARKSGSSCTI